MNINELSKEELQEIPMVEIAFEMMKEEGKPYNYYDLFAKIVKLKGLTEEEAQTRIAKLYTDINIDGRFHSLGDNQWGLKKWYPLEQTEEEITTPIKKKKKADDLDDDEDLELEEYEDDEYEDLEDELDEISDEEDADDDDEEDEYDDKDDLGDLEEDDLEDEDFEDEEEND